MPICTKCEIEKPEAAFRFRPERKWRLTECKPCEQKAQKVNYRASKKRDPVKWRVQVMRLNRSKHITLEWLEQQLAQQDYRCALSGRSITLLTLEVDHITARCNGGSDELSNLRLVCRAANAAKGALSDAELLQLCKEIIGRAILEAEAQRSTLPEHRSQMINQES